MTPQVNEEIFILLENKVIGGKKETGRPGMDLWHILVLGVVRLGLDCDYDRIEYQANNDNLMRKIMGIQTDPWEEKQESFHAKTISENICHVDEKLLEQINEIVVRHGRKIFKKKRAKK